MTTWYSKHLGNGRDALAPSSEIMKAFLSMFAAAGGPHDMAVFSHSDVGAQNVTVYFSPKTELLAKQFNATPCEQPKKQKCLGLLCGDTRATDLLLG